VLNGGSTIEFAGFTDAGLAREHNEDCIGFDRHRGIAVLADGMGGHLAGEVASQMAVDEVLARLADQLQECVRNTVSAAQMLKLVSSTITASNRKIYEASETNSQQKGMGTTVVAAVIQGSRLYAGHVGDSRLYLFRDRTLTRITRDHSLIQDLIDRGFYTEEEARNASIGHVVTRALGTAAEVEVDILQQDAIHDDLFLLCSDGLTDMLPDSKIEYTLQQDSPSLTATARGLVQSANMQGGKDNISVILIKIQKQEGSATTFNL
jgi:PPM family protein phosphatase